MLNFIDCIMVFGPVIWCSVFAMNFAIFTKVCRVFCHFLPWFSTVPSNRKILASLQYSGIESLNHVLVLIATIGIFACEATVLTIRLWKGGQHNAVLLQGAFVQLLMFVCVESRACRQTTSEYVTINASFRSLIMVVLHKMILLCTVLLCCWCISCNTW